jgi:prolyl oligopeptidase
MRHAPRAALLAVILFATAARAAELAGPPVARVAVVRDTLHGQVIEDPYRWLEDKNSPETRQWVRDEMAFTMGQLGKVPGREDVVEKLARYTRLDTRNAPAVRAGRLFFTARRADQQQPVLMMRASADAPDVVLVDPNPMDTDHTTSVALLDVSLDGTLVAYGLRKGGEDELEVHLLDVNTKQERAGGLPKGRYFGFSIDPAKRGAWFARWEPKGSRVWYHRFGDAGPDKLVYGEKLGPTEIPAPSLSDNGKWLVVSVYVGSAGDNTQVFIRDASKEGAFTSVTDTLRAQVNVQLADDTIVIETNWNAPNHRVLTVDAHRPGLKNWKEVIPERRDAVIEGASAVAGRIVVEYLHDVSSELLVFGLDGAKQAPIALPGIGSAAPPSGEWAGTDAYYTFSSFNRPPTIFRYDFTAAANREWWKSPAPFPTDRFTVRQFMATSKDGTKVPMFVVAPASIALDGSHPVLMTGYGGFNVSETPAWSARAAAWLEMGGVYVSTNLRGGSEFGETWHRAGMLAHKQHTFDDFIACAQWVIGQGYCTPSRLAIMGGSNGGLLVGAAMTQMPQLYGAVICAVPLLDMLRYHQFLVARFWVPEYGSSEDAEQFQWLRAYSPYQHLATGTKYPAVMFETGDSDTRVDPLHARKMAARMQALGGERPVLLHYDVSSGHAGGKSVDKTIEDAADELQFLRGQLGMANPQ